MRRCARCPRARAAALREWPALESELRACEGERRAACRALLAARVDATLRTEHARNPAAAAALAGGLGDVTASRPAGQLRDVVPAESWGLLTALWPVMALTADEVSRHLPATLDDGGKGGGARL